MVLAYVPIGNLNFQLVRVIEFNKTFFESWQLEILNTFKADIIVNIAHFCFISASLKCARLTLQINCFMSLCAFRVTVDKSAMKVDASASRKLTFRFGKKAK